MNYKRIALEIIRFAFGLAIIAVLVYFGSKQSVDNALRDALLIAVTPDLKPFFLCLAATLLAFLMYAYRWGYITNAIAGRKVCGFFEYFYYFITGFFSGQFISQFGGTLLVRPGMLSKRRDISYRKCVSSVFLEKVFDMILVAIMLVPCLLYVFGIVGAVSAIIQIIVIFLIVNVVLASFNEKVATFVRRFLAGSLDRIKNKPVIGRIYKEEYHERLEGIRNAKLLKPRAVFLIFIFTLIKNLFLFTRLYFLAAALGLSIPPVLILLGMPVAQLSLIMAVTPGSIGVMEAGWFFVLEIADTAGRDINPFLIGQRLYWFLFIALFYITSYSIVWYAGFRNRALKNISASARDYGSKNK